MSTPASFDPQPMPLEGRPPPGPPRFIKRQIYSDPKVFKHIDDHAVNEARTNYRTFRDIIWHLINKKNFTDLEKARAIFRWMTTKNMYTIMFDSELPGSAEAVLGAFKDGKTTYARIFECLASYAGLHCTTLSGWAKGVDYRPGAPITSGPINHSWNAVYIDGNWQLVDSHWATRYLQSERNSPENLVYEYDDFYFIPEPTHLMYSHCPEDNAWQLVYPVKSRSDFEEYPLVKSFFFSMGMQFIAQDQGVLYTNKGICVLTLGYSRPSSYTFKLSFGDNMLESFQGIPLKRYIMQETAEQRVSFYFRAPREGNYYLTVFAQHITGGRVKVENIFKAVCEFKIVCDSAAGDIRPFPQCSDANWGPGAPVKQYGLTPSQYNAILTAPNGRTEVVFQKSRPVRLYARLTKDSMDDKTLEDACSVREQDDQIYVTVHLPQRGEYGLEVYANEPDKEGETFTHMCQYLCSYIDRDRTAAYGQVYDNADVLKAIPAASLAYAAPSTGGHYASLGPKDKMRSGPMGKQVYSTSSQERDGNTFTQRSYREEQETLPDGSRMYSQRTTQGDDYNYGTYPGGNMSHSENYGGTGKRPPPVASKPGRQPGYGEDLPPPPPELMDRQHYQDQQGRPGSDKSQKPIEVVFVPGGKSPLLPRKQGENENGKAPVEIVYVPSPKMNRKGGSEERLDGETTLDRDKNSQLPQHIKDSMAILQGADVNGDPNSANYKAELEIQRKRDAVLAASRNPTGTDQPGFGPGQRSPYDHMGQDQRQTSVPVHSEPYHFGSNTLGRGADAQFFRQGPVEPEQEYRPHDKKRYTTHITIEPPTNFRALPIHDQAPKPAPPSVPPKPFKDTSIFQNVDTHAVEVSKEDHTSFRDLVWHLIYAREITNELEKARAIFLWLCSKDLTGINFTNAPKGSPEEILLNLSQGKTTYAVVYETLCSYAGLHCKTVSGYAKGAEYKPGMRFTGEQGQHSWNCVLVEGAWRLVDCHWAARRLVGKKVDVDNVRYELDEYYFMPDPHQLIFTHFPDDGNWQLLERSISLSDFENLVPVKSAFFKYGLQILSHREAVIRTNREVTIRVGCPPFKAHSLAFTFTLTDDKGGEEFQGTKLTRFGMQEMLDNVSFFTIRPPEQGAYRLILYAKDLAQQSKEGVYGGVCEYEVMMEKQPARPQAFPPCVHTSWGPGDSAHKYGLVPRQRGAIFSTVDGQAEVRFSLPKDLRFTAKLKHNDLNEKELQGYIMHRVIGDTAVFTITAPKVGEYGLEIYANDPENDGNSLYHAFQYLIICNEVKGPVEPLPVLPPGYLGVQPSFKKLGLSTNSHSDPFIQTENGDLHVAFVMSQPLRMTSQLIYVSKGQNEDCSEYILQQGRGNEVSSMLKLPKIGLYKFQVYALPFSDTSESLPGVYNYLINCRNTHSSLVAFPRQYGQWKEGCYLHEPLEGTLTANRPATGSASSYQYIAFKVEVPNAHSVAVVIGDDWTQLEQKDGVWQGEAFMEKHWGRENKAAICANYGSAKASYSTLLEYAM